MNKWLNIIVVIVLTNSMSTLVYSGEEGKGLPCDVGQIQINCGGVPPSFKNVQCANNDPQGKRWKADKDGDPKARKAVYECASHPGCNPLDSIDDGQCGGKAAVGDEPSE
ncbi:MAG: hypothetical protein HC904_10710 [Blastochloris sp.]|nr:hypothetical protein [Blastochloris sp.]